MTSTMGIMTLSRGPCDLDNMSLFQDLKLKRRKVDSRCSSDGESAADTSTSSPDPGPPSPRMAEAGCSTPPHPPPVFDGGGSPSPSPACHPTVIRSAPPYSVIKFEGAPTSVKAEIAAANKHDSAPPSQMSSVKLEGTQQESPQPYRPRTIAPPPPGTHSSLAPGPWPPSACINGVKPELIGGNFPPQPLEPKPGARGQTQWRGTPAVIMGESGGVRTMFWTLPAPTPSGEPAASASHTPTPPTPDPATCSEESAARLLLNLGGELRRPRGPPLNMELLWAGDVSQLPAHQQLHALNLSAAAGSVAGASAVPSPSALTLPRPELRTYAPETERDEDEQPMICMICEDKATGLHYGIITCEGCKGFFKRTVQNRRVYTCVADGGCEITKAQRNRCQYCRFKKCIEQGMVLQAVREDRMPGGRNSGAVYNLYKVKYKKHKKGKAATTTSRASPPEKPKEPLPPLPSHLVNGTILKTALTNPSEVVHLRARLESAVSSSRDRAVPLERALHMIRALIDCDAMEDIATVRHLPDLLHDTSEIGDKLCKIGDSIVHKMVAWTKKLPFIMEIPMEIHSKLLMEKWHEISVLTTAAYQAMHGKHANAPPSSDHEQDFMQEVSALSGERKSPDAAELPDVTHGPAHHARAVEAGRRPGGGEDDADHVRVPPHPAQDGGVRLPEGLHTAQPRSGAREHPRQIRASAAQLSGARDATPFRQTTGTLRENTRDPSSGEPFAREQNVLRSLRAELGGDQIVYGAAGRLVLDVRARDPPHVSRSLPPAPPHPRLMIAPPCVQCTATQHKSSYKGSYSG